MPELKKLITIHVSDKVGKDFCDPKCEHSVETNMFPQVITCKFSGKPLRQDAYGNHKRSVHCRYLFGEEVPDRFWSPLKDVE
jgi:hypothetical protein